MSHQKSRSTRSWWVEVIGAFPFHICTSYSSVYSTIICSDTGTVSVIKLNTSHKFPPSTVGVARLEIPHIIPLLITYPYKGVFVTEHEIYFF